MPSAPGATPRAAGIDVLRGIVVVLMTVDHAREYSAGPGRVADPMDLAVVTPLLFWLRWASHFCAPVFVLLAGVSARLQGSRMPRAALARHLAVRGLVLVALEFTIVDWAWTFNPAWPLKFAQVIWGIGVSLLVLAALVRLFPPVTITLVGMVIVAGHNLLDGVVAQGGGALHYLWAVLHHREVLLLVAGYALIPAGEFWMGCVPADRVCDAAERPRHRVALSRRYWMRRTEVTVGEFARFAASTGYQSWAERHGYARIWSTAVDSARAERRVPVAGLRAGADTTNREWRWVRGLSWARPIDPAAHAPPDWPVVQVVPADAEAFCAWDGGRLPTEAEWERAARGGQADAIHVWGNARRPRVGALSYANVPDARTRTVIPEWDTFVDYDDGFSTLAPVSRFAPNDYGLYDIDGNAYEWTADEFDSLAYGRRAGSAIARDPRTPPDGGAGGENGAGSRVVRGGSWGYYPRHHRLSFRGYFPADGFPTATVGFRCVRDSAR